MSKTYSKTRILVECALMIAIGTVLSNIKFFTMPNGGSITLLSMLPFVLVSFRHGAKWGLFTGFVNACLQMIMGFYPPPASTFLYFLGEVLLDYVLAFMALGLAELFARPFKNRTVGVAVGKNSPYTSLKEICDAANSGKELTLATTGTGGLPWEVSALITSITGASFTQVQYDSDASARVAVLGGECDFTICKVQSCLEEYKSGDLKLLCMLANDTVAQMPDVPLITEEYPEFAEYLPWGPFYGVFVKEGTDPAVVETLSNAFTEAFNDASYQEVLKNYNINPMGYTGDEAKAYLASWRENTVNALTKAGAIS